MGNLILLSFCFDRGAGNEIAQTRVYARDVLPLPPLFLIFSQDPTMSNIAKENALHCAVTLKNDAEIAEVVKILLEKGMARLSTPESYTVEPPNKGHTLGPAILSFVRRLSSSQR